jgi:hypothetical protein
LCQFISEATLFRFTLIETVVLCAPADWLGIGVYYTLDVNCPPAAFHTDMLHCSDWWRLQATPLNRQRIADNLTSASAGGALPEVLIALKIIQAHQDGLV